MERFNKILEVYSKKQQYFALFFDFFIAFDLINHSIQRNALFENLLDISKPNWALNDFLLSNYSLGISLDESIKINQVNPK
jgi:hypothetical protein